MGEVPMTINRWKSSLGSGNTGCLFSLALLLLFAYVSYSLVPIFYNGKQFENDADSIVRKMAVRGSFSEEKARSDIWDLAGKREIPLKKENIKIQRLSDRIVVDVDYDREFKTPVYTKVFHFSFRVESFVGAL